MNSADHVRFTSFDSVHADDLESFRLLTGPSRMLSKGKHLRDEGSPNPEVFRLLSGWLTCSVATPEGGRQVTKIHLPGDLVGMPSLGCSIAVETIQAVTQAEVESIPAETFGLIFRDHPRLAGQLFLWANEERQHLMNGMMLIGRMQGDRRLAAWLLLLYRRIALGRSEPFNSFEMPLKQQDVADAIGLTVVHTNRSLTALRERGIATWRKHILTIHDVNRLTRFANIPSDPIRSTQWIPDTNTSSNGEWRSNVYE